MCVVSMVADHYWDKWNKPPYTLPPTPVFPVPSVIPTPQMPSQEEIDEFQRLLRRAREYDKKHNEPDCELEEKKARLLKLAEDLGIKISFE